MDAIIELTKIDFTYVFLSVFVILIGLKAIVSIIEWIVDKLGLETRRMRERREEHDLLIQTSQNLTKLQERHTKDAAESDIHDERIRQDLTAFMDEMKNIVAETQENIQLFSENRIHDREQSLQIQKELTDSIKDIVTQNTIKDKQIDALMVAQKEILADKINEKYKYYLSIKGIPEDEIDEFASLHQAYKTIGGNHNGDAKYEYCINHLQVIPVETRLIMDIKDNTKEFHGEQ